MKVREALHTTESYGMIVLDPTQELPSSTSDEECPSWMLIAGNVSESFTCCDEPHHHQEPPPCTTTQPSLHSNIRGDLSDLPMEVLGHICKYLLRERVFGKELANDLLPLLHTNKTLHDKIYYNPFIWNDVQADLHHFVASYMPEGNYSTTCFSVLCDERFKNTDFVIGRFNGQFAYYYSVECEMTEMFFSFVETLCDASSLIQNIKMPLPLISSYSPPTCSPSISFTNFMTTNVLSTHTSSKTTTDLPTSINTITNARNHSEPIPLLKKWVTHFPNAKSLSFVSSNECVENARPNDLVPYVQDLSFYHHNSCKFQSLQGIQVSGSVNGFERLLKAHSSELQSLSALSVFSFTTKSKHQELQKIETILQQCSNIRRVTLENPIIVEPDNYNLFMKLSSRLTSLSLEVSFSFLAEGNDWKNLCHSLTNLKKLNLNIGSFGNGDFVTPITETCSTLKFSALTDGIPLPKNITHLGLSNFMDSPISIILDGCELSKLIYLHAYKVLLSVSPQQQPFPHLETFEYMTEMRDCNERRVIQFWMEQHLSLKKFSYQYDWDNGEFALSNSDKTLLIKRHPTLHRLKLACDKSDVHIEHAPSIVSIIGVPSSLKLNGSHVQKLSFNICNTGNVPSLHKTSIYDITLKQCDLFAVEIGKNIDLSHLKFNSSFIILRKAHLTFSDSIRDHQVFDVANILPMHSETLSLDEMKINFQDKLPLFLIERLSNTLCQFNSIKEFTAYFAWLKTTIRGFSSQFKTLNVSNFLDVTTYLTKDEKNCRQISNPHMSFLKVESEELGDFTTISCPSMTQLLCTSLNLKYSPHAKPSRKIIIDLETSQSLRDIKVSFAQLVLHNVNNIQLSHVQSLELTDPSLRVEIDLQHFPNLSKLELSKIQSEIKIIAQGNDESDMTQSNNKNVTPLYHSNLQHVFINMVYSLHVHMYLIAPKLRSFTLTNISQTHPESKIELVSTPKLIRKIIHLNLHN